MRDKNVIADRLLLAGYKADRKSLLQYDADTLQGIYERFTARNNPRKRHHKRSEYAHPFSCEGLGQW